MSLVVVKLSEYPGQCSILVLNTNVANQRSGRGLLFRRTNTLPAICEV